MNGIQDFITSDPATQEAAKVDEQLNHELGLVIPDGVMTESLVYWQTYFRTLRNMYRADMIDTEDVQTVYLPKFASIPDLDKQTFLNQLIEKVDQHLQEINEAETILALEGIQRKIDKIMAILPPELQVEFIKELNGGKIPEDIEREINQYSQEDVITPEEAEAYASYRLTHALDKRNSLDTRKFNTPLAATDVQNIVDEHDRLTRPLIAKTITKPTAPTSRPVVRQPLPTQILSFEPQNTTPTTIIDSVVNDEGGINYPDDQDIAPTQKIQSAADLIPSKKMATLDDLLHTPKN